MNLRNARCTALILFVTLGLALSGCTEEPTPEPSENNASPTSTITPVVNPAFTFFGQDPDDPQLWADALRLDPDAFAPGQYEWWYSDGHLSNGMTFVASYHLEVRPGGEVVPYITINLASDEGVIQDERIYFTEEDASFSTETCDVNIGKHFIRSTDGWKSYEIYIDPDTNNGNGLHLTLQRTVPSYAPGPDSGANPEGPYFRWVCAVPNGKLSGTVTVHGTTHEVSGSGYHDHNWGNVPMSALVEDWHWSRGEADGYTAVSASVRFKNGVTLNNVYVASEKDGVLVAEATGPMRDISFLEGSPQPQPDTGKIITTDALHFVKNGYVHFQGNAPISSFIFGEDAQQRWWYTRYDAELSIVLHEGDQRIEAHGHAILENMDFNGEPTPQQP